VVRAEAFVGLKEGDELAEDAGDAAAVDLVDEDGDGRGAGEQVGTVGAGQAAEVGHAPVESGDMEGAAAGVEEDAGPDGVGDDGVIVGAGLRAHALDEVLVGERGVKGHGEDVGRGG
jgi:hypothetical protein